MDPNMNTDNPLEQFFIDNAICNACISRWQFKPDQSTTKDSLPPEPKRPRSEEPPARVEKSTQASAVCPLCFGLSQANSTLFEVDFTPPSLLFNTDINTSTNLPSPRDAVSISQPPPQPQVLKSFPSLSEAIQALREVWDFDSYALEVSLPAVFALRGQAAWWAAQSYLTTDEAHSTSNMPGSSKTKVTVRDVREALRHHYSCQLTDIFGKGPDQTSTMRLSFGCRLATETENEAQWLAPPPPKVGRRQRFLNKKRGQDAGRNAYVTPLPLLASPTIVSKLATMPKEEFLEKCPHSAVLLSSPPPLPNETHNNSNTAAAVDTTTSNVAVVTIAPYRQAQYIGGRYIKLLRGLPQSPWFDFDGERRGDSSVQEEIAKIVLPSLRADEYTFISSGREDIDVRMLGNGRPFAFEVKNMRAGMPTKDAAEELEKQSILINSGVEVRNLGPLGTESMVILKDGEQEKKKSYAAVCWLPKNVTNEDLEKINALGKQGDLEIEQWTPLRVLHRRPNLCRRRAVHEMSAEVLPDLPPGYFLLRLTTAAGTYVKEFVHGDRGRTTPCIKDILKCSAAECVYLDVTGVDLEF